MRRELAGVLVLVFLIGSVCLAKEKAVQPADDKNLVQGNNAFAFDLYGRLRQQPGNTFFSPYSISTALAMTYAGANGGTAQQMAKTLHFGQDQDAFHSSIKGLMAGLQGGDKKRPFELHVANALWGQKGYGFLDSFLNLTRQSYGAELRQVDFIGEPEETRQAINAWVEKETRERIKDLIARGVLDSNTRLVLTNAIYFKSAWADPFYKEATRKEDFLVTAQKKTPVQMMHQHQRTMFFEGDALQMLELPYKGNELSMLVLLPKKVEGLADLEKNLTAKQLAAWQGVMKPHQVDVALPKFKITASFSLKDELSALGMPAAFSPNDADFSRMNGKRDLFVSAVIHKAFVDVNEEGTEAAAATAVGIAKSAAPPPLPRATFRADHPFVFVIRHNGTGSLLFLGRVASPE